MPCVQITLDLLGSSAAAASRGSRRLSRAGVVGWETGLRVHLAGNGLVNAHSGVDTNWSLREHRPAPLALSLTRSITCGYRR